MEAILANRSVSVTELKRNFADIISHADDGAIAVLNHNKPAAYLLSARAYEALLDKLDDAALTEVVKARRTGKPVKVKLDQL